MIWDLEIAQTKQLDELRQCIASYNDMLHQMELAPHTARYAGGNTFHLELDVHAESSASVCLSVCLIVFVSVCVWLFLCLSVSDCFVSVYFVCRVPSQSSPVAGR